MGEEAIRQLIDLSEVAKLDEFAIFDHRCDFILPVESCLIYNLPRKWDPIAHRFF